MSTWLIWVLLQKTVFQSCSRFYTKAELEEVCRLLLIREWGRGSLLLWVMSNSIVTLRGMTETWNGIEKVELTELYKAGVRRHCISSISSIRGSFLIILSFDLIIKTSCSCPPSPYPFRAYTLFSNFSYCALGAALPSPLNVHLTTICQLESFLPLQLSKRRNFLLFRGLQKLHKKNRISRIQLKRKRTSERGAYDDNGWCQRLMC